VPILSERIGEVPGKHSVTWTSANDKITITHEAFGRTGFATGACVARAKEWLTPCEPRSARCCRACSFTMDDVLAPVPAPD
jgi:dihydrodipicolinate reductase